jgi:hypothetical protein
MKSLGSRPKGTRQERLQASPRWAGDGFRNVHPVMPGLKDPNTPMPTVKDFFCEDGRRVPTGPLPSTNPLETWRSKPQSGLRVTWLGHSTVLIEIDGVRVLTDPVCPVPRLSRSWAGASPFRHAAECRRWTS